MASTNTSVVAPSYPRDYEFHHLAVRFPFMGEEVKSDRFEKNNERAKTIRDQIENDQLWMMRRLGSSTWLCRGIGVPRNRRSKLLVTKRAAIIHPDQGEDISGTPMLDSAEDIPAYLRFTNLPDKGLVRWSKGRYLSRKLNYFPRLEHFSYQKVEYSPGWDLGIKKEKDPHLVFAGLYKYYNGGTLEQLMAKRDAIYRKYSSDNPQLRWTPYRLPETLIWHILSEIGQALLKLQTGEPRDDDEDKINGMKNTDEWKPIIHGRIVPRNIYLHFDEAALASQDEEKRLKASCFPQVILGNFSLAGFEEDESDDPADLPEPNYYRYFHTHRLAADDQYEQVNRRWWDCWFFGLLFRKMLLFGDCGIINKSRTADPEGGDTRKKFPDYLEEETLGMIKWSTLRYFGDAQGTEALANINNWYGNPGWRDWDRELKEGAWSYESRLMTDYDNGVTPPGKHFSDDDVRPFIPNYEDIRNLVAVAKAKVAEFMARPMRELHRECQIADDHFGPWDYEEDTMIYRPQKELGREYEGVRIWNSQDAVTSDMEPFLGPWSYLFIRYISEEIRMRNRPHAPGPEDDINDVLPFGPVPYIWQQNPDPAATEEDPHGDPLGKTIAEKHRRAQKEHEMREEAKRQRKNKLNEMGRPEGWAPLTATQRYNAERAYYYEEEEETHRRRARAAFENRGDILLEAWNSVVIQGLGSRPTLQKNINRGFWDRWREGSADSFEITNDAHPTNA
ncbi:hypothetical protein V8F20_004161 [Naviculisporaceae sp. PSN 640]